MKFKALFISLLAVTFALARGSNRAQAQSAESCGNFDFSSGISCKIEVEGGCQAQCTPLKFEAACTGGCSVEADTQCVDSCGTQCVLTCDPSLLDCFAGCHSECDAPTQELCESNGTRDDCADVAIAECDIHCNESCEVPPSDCQEHCNRCCTGSCTTQVNFDCNLSCFAELEGGCDVQCAKPNGALFCNGQYVNASDIEECILYLSQQGIDVDVSARGSVTCDLSGCEGDGSTGCSAASTTGSAFSLLLMAFALLTFWRPQRAGQKR